MATCTVKTEKLVVVHQLPNTNGNSSDEKEITYNKFASIDAVKMYPSIKHIHVICQRMTKKLVRGLTIGGYESARPYHSSAVGLATTKEVSVLSFSSFRQSLHHRVTNLTHHQGEAEQAMLGLSLHV